MKKYYGKKYFGSEWINVKGRANRRMLKAAQNVGTHARNWDKYRYLVAAWQKRRDARPVIFL